MTDYLRYEAIANKDYHDSKLKIRQHLKVKLGSCVEIQQLKLSLALKQATANQQIKALTDKINLLEQSNRELTQFAYVATHDLQEPLRKIKIFTDRLVQKASSKLNDDEKSYLDKIKTSSARMSNLIKDVLDYSVLSESNETFRKTNLNQIVQHILTDFELLITQKNAIIEMEELPSITAVPLQMNQLFNNLISNSLKFTKEGVQPMIAIQQSTLSITEKQMHELDIENTYIKITFSDNGIGFNEEYAERIFEIFQRLNGKEDYAGTGIGLALCKKIIDNHQGKIIAESSLGNGAIFHVILPMEQG